MTCVNVDPREVDSLEAPWLAQYTYMKLNAQHTELTRVTNLECLGLYNTGLYPSWVRPTFKLKPVGILT